MNGVVASVSEARIRPRGLTILGLSALVAAVACLQLLLSWRIKTPWIVPDELIYSELAKSLAAGELPGVRGMTSLDYGLIYPLLIAPAWALSPDAESAFELARIINAFVMAGAAIPMFFLARKFVSRRNAAVVAAFTVFVPSMAYAGTLMTEVALYPAFLFALLAIAGAVERPTAKRQLLAWGAIGLAFAVKPLAVVLVGVYVAAIVIYALLEGRGRVMRTSLAQHRLSWWMVVGSCALAVAAGGILTGDPFRALGVYSVVIDHVDALGTARWFVGNLSALALYVVVLPFAATLAVLIEACGPAATSRDRLFVAVATPATIGVIALVAAFGSEEFGGAEGFNQPSTSLRERNLFIVAPLFLLGLALWIERRGTSRRVFAVSGLATIAVLVAYPWHDQPVSTGPQNLAPIPWILLTPEGLGRVVAIGVIALLLLALLRSTPRDKVGRLWLAVGTVFLLTGITASLVFANVSQRTLAWGLHNDPDWIDAAVGPGNDVAVLWYEPGVGYAKPMERHRVVWVNEFFNSSVGTVFAVGGRMPYALPETRATVNADSVVAAGGEPVRARFVLTCGTPVVGVLLARDRATGAALYRTDGRVRTRDAVLRACPGGRGSVGD